MIKLFMHRCIERVNSFVVKLNEWLTIKRAIIIFFVLGFSTYVNILFNEFVLDDIPQIVKNPSIWSLSNISGLFFSQFGGVEASGYYRPLVYVAYTILYSVFQTNEFFYHGLQIVLHIINTGLVYLILSNTVKKNVAFFLSLVFLLHPMNQEVVAYIANLQDVLFLFFGLVSLYFVQKNQAKSSHLLYSSVCLFLALLSKETAILFFVVSIFYVYLFRRSKIFIHALFSSIAVLIFVVMRVASHTPFSKEAIIPIMSQSFIERMLNVPAILSYYIRTFFFPKDLVVLHSWVVRDIELNTFFIPLFIVFSFTAALYVTGRVIYRKQKGRQLLFFSLWFLIGLFVHVQIVPIDTTVSDRYFYFPFVGLLAIIGLFIASLHISRPGVTVVGVGLGVIVLIVLSARTIIRNRDWVDQSTLIAHDIQISKDDYLLEHLYSSALLKENKDDEALFHIKKAMELYPDSKPAWTNLGVYYYKKGDVEQAKSSLQRAISLGDFYAAYENMAMIKYEHDSLIDAMDFTRKATSLFPNSEKLWFRRLLIGQKLRDYEEVSLSSRNCYYSGGNDYCFKIYQQVMQNSTVQ